MSRKRVVVIAVVVAALAATVGAVAVWRGWFADPTIDDAPDRSAGAIEDVVTGLAAPWGLAFLPDGTALVTERDTARILSVSGGAAREVGRVEEAAPSGEGGLLGIAVSPNYATDRLVYIYFTAAQDNRVARMRLGETPVPILTGIPKAGNHDGGRIAFGPDGMLYVGTGDAGVRGASQDRASLAGKILRLTPDGQAAPGNPFNSPIYSYGHRNVQGLAWDSTGTLYASEFGQNTYDELNRITAGGNYGWPDAEGISDNSQFINPIATWSTQDASPSGIAVGADGKIYMACLRGQRLYQISTDGSGAAALLRGEYGRLRHVALAPDGWLWVLTSNKDGRGNPRDGDDRIIRLKP